MPKLNIDISVEISDYYEYVVAGNLALSRALGDFVFKRNNMKLPEEQIVTGLSLLFAERSLHHIFVQLNKQNIYYQYVIAVLIT